MDLSQKRRYMFHKINKMKDTSGIYDLIQKMNIPKTKNANGIFVNLSALGENEIHELYEFVEKINCHLVTVIPDQVFPPEPISDLSEAPSVPVVPKYKKMKLTNIQKTILSYGI